MIKKYRSERIRAREFRHRNRIRHGENDGNGRDADRKGGGPRYLLKGLAGRSGLRLELRCARSTRKGAGEAE